MPLKNAAMEIRVRSDHLY